MTAFTTTEKIAAFEAKRAANVKAMEDIGEKAGGDTFDESQQDEFDGYLADNEAIDAQLKRYRALEKASAASAKPVAGDSAKAAAVSRIPGSGIQVKRELPKGTIFTRLAAAKIVAKLDMVPAASYAESKFGDTPEVAEILKAAVAVGNTTDANWASPLVQLQQATEEFLDLLRPATIIGRIDGLTRVPFNVRVPVMTTDPTAYWVGEGQTKPVSAAAFDSVTLGFSKAVGISVITEELARFSSPSAEGILRNALTAAVAYITDRTFVDPTAASTGSSPASVTNGVSPIAPSGTTADAFRDDMVRLLKVYLAANYGVTGLVLIMTAQQALALSIMVNSLGNREFPELSVSGGAVMGIPVVVSENIPAAGGSPTDGYPIIALHAPSVFLADEGGVNIDMSREASLQMDNAPDSPATASTVMRSLWQDNNIALKAERFISWKKGRSGAAQYIQGANYL